MTPRTSAAVPAWVCAALMAACSSTPTRLFSLYAVPPASDAHGVGAGIAVATPNVTTAGIGISTATANGTGVGAAIANGAPVRVDAVHLPPALDRIEMVSNVGRGELNISDVNHWSAPLAQEARQALSADLIARLPAGRVIFPQLTKPDDALGITVDILEFEAGGTGAWLQASWVIGPAEKARPSTAVVRTQSPVDGAAATARALSELLGQLADRIAADLGGPIPP